MADEKYPRLRDALEKFNGVDVFVISESGTDLLVRYDGAAEPAHVFAELTQQRLTPKGVGLMTHKQRGLKT